MIKFLITLLFSSQVFAASNYPNMKLGIDALNDLLNTVSTNTIKVDTDHVSVTNTVSTIAAFGTRSDTFIATTSGTIISMLTMPASKFSISCAQTGAVTSWTAVLEGSLDNSNFTTILTHTNVVGTGITVFSNANASPSLYIRSRVTAIILGGGTNIVCTILGMQ